MIGYEGFFFRRTFLASAALFFERSVCVHAT